MLNSDRLYFKSNVIAQCVAMRSDCSRCPYRFGSCTGLHDLLMIVKKDYIEMVGNYLREKEKERSNV